MSNKKTSCSVTNISLSDGTVQMKSCIRKTNILPYPEVKKILEKATAKTIKTLEKP